MSTKIWIDLAKSFNHRGTDADIEKLLGEMADELDIHIYHTDLDTVNSW